MRNIPNRVLLYLLLGALVLSAALNCYLLKQRNDLSINYELEAGLPSSITELELEQARAQLAACRGRQLLPDSTSLVQQ